MLNNFTYISDSIKIMKKIFILLHIPFSLNKLFFQPVMVIVVGWNGLIDYI